MKPRTPVLLVLLVLVLTGCAPHRPPVTSREQPGKRASVDEERAEALPTAVIRAMIRDLGPPPPEPPPPPCSTDIKDNFRRWMRANLDLMRQLYRCPDLRHVTSWTILRLEIGPDGLIFKASLVERATGAVLRTPCLREIFAGQRIRCAKGHHLRVEYPVHPCFALGPDDMCR